MLEEIEIIENVLRNRIWHEDTKKVYIEMLQDEFAKEKPIYKFNKETQILAKAINDIDYCI
jgi:hypothetical protein